MQTAVIYARYSSHAQRDVSIDQQVDACRQYASRHSFRIIDVYADHALTGTNDNRPAFQRMIRDSEAQAWDYVLVYATDRFARDRYDSAVYKRQLKRHGVRVLSVTENITDDPTGILMESMLEGLAEYYSASLSQKVRRGLDDNASKCLVNTPLPLGYQRGPDGRYQICEPEAAVVREIYRRVAGGEPLIDICRDLNARGLRTRKGAQFNRGSFNVMLQNERYTGVYIYKDIRTPGGIPAIISPELFQAVQAQLRHRPNARKSAAPHRRRREAGVYLLTGKLFCGHCREPMVGVSGNGKSGTLYHYYKCRGRLAHSGCDKATMRRDDIEELVCMELRKAAFTPTTMVALADAAIRYQDAQPEAHDVSRLEEELQTVTRSIDNLVRAIEAGIFSPATQVRLNDLESERRDLEGALTLARSKQSQRLTRAQILAALEMFAAGDVKDPDYQAALLDAFLYRVYAYDDHLDITFHLPGGDVESSSVRIDAPEADHNCLYEHVTPTIIMIDGLFLFRVALE